jgi:hypothetical protein
LTDAELTAAVRHLAERERQATAALLVHLAEFDARRLYEGAGFPSLFQYCRAVLHLSEDAVYNRIEAARALRRYPAIEAMLLAGTLSPTTVRMLARHLTPENHRELLAAAAGLGKQDVEHLLARRFPQPDVPATVRKQPAPREAARTHQLGTMDAGANEPSPSTVTRPLDDASPSAIVVAAAPPLARARVRPLAPERYEIRFTARAETREKLREAQDLLGHAIPSGDIAEVVDRALTLLVEDLRRRKCAETSRPREGARPSGESRVPAAVRRVVWRRDGGRCAFVAASGRRCDATRCVEFHHVEPRAVGGLATVANIQLRCRAHNGHEVDLFFGPGVRRGHDDARAIQGPATGAGTRSGTTSAGGVGPP